MSDHGAAMGSARLRRWFPWLLLGVGLIFLLIMAWMRRYTIDDAFINYRIVHQLEAGNGPVFNAGERVEAFTSPAWLAMLWIFDLVLPVRLEWIGMAGGIVLGVAGVVFAALGSHRLYRGDAGRIPPALLIPLGAAVVIVLPATWRLLAMGLENGLSFAWLGAAMWVLGRWATRDGPLGFPSAFLLGLGVLVRPDLAPFCALFLLAVLIGDRGVAIRRRVGMVAVAAALPVAVQIARMGYYGMLVPNTALTKSAGEARWGFGWWYLDISLGSYWFWIPAIVLAAIGYGPFLARYRWTSGGHPELGRRSALVVAAFGLGALICTFYVVRIGGDYIATRLLLPAVFGFLCPIMFVRCPRLRDIEVAVPMAVVGVWVVVCGFALRLHPEDTVLHKTVTLSDTQNLVAFLVPPEIRNGHVYENRHELPYQGAMGDTPIIITYGIGKVGYAVSNDVYVFDQLGLALPVAAHLELRARGLPGHEKILPEPWIAALTTTPGSPVVASDFPQKYGVVPIHGRREHIRRQDDPAGHPFLERVGTARGVLDCREMQDFRAGFTDPLSLRLFVANMAHSWHNTELSIPGEPTDAAEALCTPAERSRIESSG